MSDFGILFLLYGAGVLILVAEIFIPSHGILTVAGLGFLSTAVVRTFLDFGREAGVASALACLVALPVFGYVSVKYWRRTPIGRRIVPANPVLTSADTSVPIERLSALVGRTGRAVSALRPVGVCEFGGCRVSCVTELGVVEAGSEVLATGIVNGNLAVTPGTA